MIALANPSSAPSCWIRRIGDRKSTRLNSSHSQISYAVFCLKKKKLAYHSIPQCLPIDPSPFNHGGKSSTALSHCFSLSARRCAKHSTPHPSYLYFVSPIWRS